MSKSPSAFARRIALATLSAWCTVATAGGPAMLTDLSGHCEWDEPGFVDSCKLVRPVPVDTVIELGTDGRIVLVYLTTAEEYEFTGAAVIRVQPDGPAVEKGQRGEARKLDRLGSTELSPLADGALVQAAIVLRTARSQIEPVWPSKVELMSKEPEFKWNPNNRDGRFTVVVNRADGSPFDSASITGKSSLALSKDIEPGTYRWHIEHGSERSKNATFTVVDDAERARRQERLAGLEQRAPGDDAPFSQRVLYAALLQKNGLYEAARERWQALHRERPDIEELATLAR